MSGTAVGVGMVEAVQSLIGRENVRTGAQVRPYRLGAMDPHAAAFPGDEAEVSKLLALAWREGARVVPWGGGLHQTIGNQPEGYDLALDLGRMNRILEHEPGDLTATVQCGIRMADLQANLAKQGQFLPLDPPLAEGASLGGILATNLNGPLRCRYGAVRDLTLGVRIVHADGTITQGGAKVVKNATAYDITKMYLGSLGTLGVIVAASMRLYPRPQTESAWEFVLSELEQGQELATRILGSHCMPTRVELLDRGEGQGSLFVSCAGIPEAVAAQGDLLRRLAAGTGAVPSPVAEPSLLWRHVGDFPWRALGGNADRPRLLWRAGVLPSACAEGMWAMRRAAPDGEELSMAASVAGGIIRGAVVAEDVESLPAWLEAAREAVVGLGGYLALLDAPAAVRGRVDAWGPLPEGFPLMRRMKDAFDSRRILNPGRFVGGI